MRRVEFLHRQCPRDWTPLAKEARVAHGRTFKVDICPKCRGMFLEMWEVKALTGHEELHKLFTKYLDLDTASPLVCPSCGGLMDAEDAGDVKVDVCIQCHGLWLDAGELERLRTMDPAVYMHFTPERIQKILQAREIRKEERAEALRAMFRGLVP